MSAFHTFDKSFAENQFYEAELDKHFGQAYIITKATREDERRGIDRFFCHRATGLRYSVEYKTDHKTPETGNVFVETRSVDTAGKAGWAYTSMAQVLVYFVPAFETAYRADMTEVKRRIGTWLSYPEGTAWNKGRDGSTYRTLGRLVPLGVFRAACVQEHDVAAPLDVTDLGFLLDCKHEMPSSVCRVCNGTVKKLIREAS